MRNYLGTQNFLIETVNYEVDPLKGSAPKKYLEITSEGNATFVEDQTRPKQRRMQFGDMEEGF